MQKAFPVALSLNPPPTHYTHTQTGGNLTPHFNLRGSLSLSSSTPTLSSNHNPKVAGEQSPFQYALLLLEEDSLDPRSGLIYFSSLLLFSISSSWALARPSKSPQPQQFYKINTHTPRAFLRIMPLANGRNNEIPHTRDDHGICFKGIYLYMEFGGSDQTVFCSHHCFLCNMPIYVQAACVLLWLFKSPTNYVPN